MLTYFPKYFTSKAIALYFVSLLVVSVAFMSHALSWLWVAFGAVSVVSFFCFSNLLTKKWGNCSVKFFTTRLFWTAFIIRVIYVIFSYFFYVYMTGETFEFAAGDVRFYHEMGKYGSQLLHEGVFDFWDSFQRYSGGMNLSDSGYPVYLSFIYFLTNDSILLTRILKAVWSAWTCVLIYKVASRNFGESTGRMAAIFCMLMPNLIYYCGLHLKETEMVFLIVLFIERADFVLRASKIPIAQVCVMIVIGGILFTFRTVLGAVAFAALFMALTFSNSKIVGWGKRIIVGIIVCSVIALAFTDRIISEVSTVWGDRENNQSTSLQWRAERKGGNQFAKYAGAAVFAPLIFTIPFPTMTETPGQKNQKMIHGGNYIKNITSFFTIFGLLLLLTNGNWRKHVLPLTFMSGYLLVIAFSAFAQSERFHLPALPFALMFAAYGVSQLQNKHKRWYMCWLAFIFIAIVGWQWFKLKGRGMI